jgi:hypothetical protein
MLDKMVITVGIGNRLSPLSLVFVACLPTLAGVIVISMIQS